MGVLTKEENGDGEDYDKNDGRRNDLELCHLHNAIAFFHLF